MGLDLDKMITHLKEQFDNAEASNDNQKVKLYGELLHKFLSLQLRYSKEEIELEDLNVDTKEEEEVYSDTNMAW